MFSHESEDERMTMKMKRQEVRTESRDMWSNTRLRTRILLILVATNIFDSFVRKRDPSIRVQRGVGASKAREAPPWNKRIMWTRFDVFEYLISFALKPSHHSHLITVQTLAIIEVELTKDGVTSSCMTDRFLM